MKKTILTICVLFVAYVAMAFIPSEDEKITIVLTKQEATEFSRMIDRAKSIVNDSDMKASERIETKALLDQSLNLLTAKVVKEQLPKK